METSSVSASPAEIPGEESEIGNLQEIPTAGTGNYSEKPLDKLLNSKYFFDYNYYVPFNKGNKNYDTEFYDNLRNLARRQKEQKRKSELKKLRRLAFNKQSDEITQSHHFTPVTMEYKLQQARMLFGIGVEETEEDDLEDEEKEERVDSMNEEEKEEGDSMNEEEMEEVDSMNEEEKEEVDSKNDNEKEEVDLKNDNEKEEVDLKNDNEKEEVDLKNDKEKEEVDLKNGNEEEEVDLKNEKEKEEVDLKNEKKEEEDLRNEKKKEEVDSKNDKEKEEEDLKNEKKKEEVDSKNDKEKEEEDLKNEKKKEEVDFNKEEKKEKVENEKVVVNYERKVVEDKIIENNKTFDDDKYQPVKTWADVKIVRNKHPLDPSSFGNEVIKKIFHKKKPKRRVKVPFVCRSQLPQRLNQEMEQYLSQRSSNSTKQAAMVLHIGRNRPLYQEQLDNLSHLENSDCITTDWAKLAASAVQTDLNSTKVSRLLIPVLCDKLVKLIEFNDELKQYDGGFEYGINRIVKEDGDMNELEEGKKEQKDAEEKKVKRKGVSAVVKQVVAKLVDTVVAEEEHVDVNAVKVVSEKRVGRELKRLNASYIELEEESTSTCEGEEGEDTNLAKVEKEYHQTVVRKRNEIIFVNNKHKRLRRRPMKLEDHVLEVGDNEEEKLVKCRRLNAKSPCNEIKTEEIRRVEASVEEELFCPPVKDCSVKLVKAFNLDDIENTTEHTAADETEKVEQKIEKNVYFEETYVEDTCSLPKFMIKVPDIVASPPLFKAKRYSSVPISPPMKKRRVEDNSPEKKKSIKRLKNGEVIENLSLKTILKPTDENIDSMQNRSKSHSSPESPLRLKPDGDGISNDNVSVHPAGTQKRIKTLKPVRRPDETVTEPEEPEMSVKILSVMSLNPEATVMPNRREDILQELGAAAGRAAVIPTQVRFLKVPINQQFEKITHRDKELEVVFGKGKLSFALTILNRNLNNEMVFIPAVKTIEHNEDKYFGVYFHHQSLSTAFVGPYQLDEEPQIYLKLKSDAEPIKYEGEFCVDGVFVVAFWKLRNRKFERRICKDPNVKQLAVYLYRRRNQEKSGSQGFVNISQEASKLNDKNRQSSLSSIENFRVKPLSDKTKNSIENGCANSPAGIVERRCKSPDLDIEKMEIDFVDSVDVTSKSNESTGDKSKKIVAENNDSPKDQQILNSKESKPDVLIDKMKTDKNEQIVNDITTKLKQPKMKNGKIESGQPTLDDLTFYEYARNMNKLALNNVEMSYNLMEVDDLANAKKIERTVTNNKNSFEKLSENKEVEIIYKRKKIVNDVVLKNDGGGNKDKTQALNKVMDVVDLDSMVPKPDEIPPVTKPKVVENTASPPKKLPISHCDLGVERKILPKLDSPDQGLQKVVLRFDTPKSILNPVKVVLNPEKSASNSSNSVVNGVKMIPISQINSNTLPKSILRNIEQKKVQASSREGMKQKVLIQTKVGSQMVNIQWIPKNQSTLIEATPQQNIIQTTLKKPPPQISVNLKKLVDDKLALQKQSVSPGEKKLIELTKKPLPENNNVMANMISLGGNKVMVTVPMMKVVKPNSVIMDKTGNNFIQVQPQNMSQTNKKEVGKKFIKIPPNAQSIKILPDIVSGNITTSKTLVKLLPMWNGSKSVNESPTTKSLTNNVGNIKPSNSTMSTNSSLPANVSKGTSKSENATINKSQTIIIGNEITVTDTSKSTTVDQETSSNVISTNKKETSQNRILNESDESTEKTNSSDKVTNVNDECKRSNKSSIEDPDALKILSNWKYNTQYMQSLGLFVDEDL